MKLYQIIALIIVFSCAAGVSLPSCALNPEGALAGQQMATSGQGGADSSSTSSGSPGGGGGGDAGGAPTCIQKVFPGENTGEDCNDVLFPRVLSEGLTDEWNKPLNETNALILGRVNIPGVCKATGFGYTQVSVTDLCGQTAHNAVWFTQKAEQPDTKPSINLIAVNADQPPWNQNERVLDFIFPQPVGENQYLFVGTQLAIPDDKNRTCVLGCGDAVGINECFFSDTLTPIDQCPTIECSFEPLKESPIATAIARRATFRVSVTLDCCPL